MLYCFCLLAIFYSLKYSGIAFKESHSLDSDNIRANKSNIFFGPYLVLSLHLHLYVEPSNLTITQRVYFYF